MQSWYSDHESMRYWLQWAIYTDAFRLASAFMYVIFAAGLWSLGAQYQRAIVHKDQPPAQFPEGYFTMLAVQLIPLTLTGFVLHDVYIICTRIGTLGMVLVVHGMIASRDGTYASRAYRLMVMLWFSIAIMGPMIWISSKTLQTFVHDWETYIAYSSVAMMIVFVIWGQGVAARALFHHYMQGNYTIKRLRLQFVRFLGFLFQSLHYGLSPLVVGGTFAWRDPIFLQGAIGTVGVSIVLLMAGVGFVRGSTVRWEKKREKRQLARQSTQTV